MNDTVTLLHDADAAAPAKTRPASRAKVLFYIDSRSALTHCLAAANALKARLDADIVVMATDSDTLTASMRRDFQIHDYAELFHRKRTGPGRYFGLGIRHKLGRLFRSFMGAEKSVGQIALGMLAVVILFFPLMLLRLTEWIVDAIIGLFLFLDRPSQGLALGRRRWLFDSLVQMKPYVRGQRAKLWRLLERPTLGPKKRAKVKPKAAPVIRQPGRFERLRFWLRSVRGVEKFLAVQKPDLIVLPEDNIETLSRIFVARGKRRRIPTLIIPNTIPNPAEPAQFYYEDPKYDATGFLARILTSYRPAWRFEHTGRALLRLSARRALAVEVLGLATPAPWILNRGSAAAVALDSAAQRDTYLALGFPAEQLHVVGDTQSAAMFACRANKEERLAALTEKYALMPDRPLVLCAFPPDQYLGTSTKDFEFPTFEAMAASWMTALASLEDTANIVVNPHPRLPAHRLARFERPNLRLCTESVSDLIPLCDLYVASISATIRSAIACGTPVINYDTFRYRYDDYLKADGVVHVEDAASFRTALTHFFHDPAFASDLVKKQRGVMRHWGLVDDGFADRLARLAEETMGRSRPHGVMKSQSRVEVAAAE